ncbi:MAG: glycosyltransferase family 4 protein [Candidatus Cyclobacteriaceae bacterium M3_2C_046]
MRTAVVSFGHVDVSLPLVKHLNQEGQLTDLILVFSQNKKRESLLNFSDVPVNHGFLSKSLKDQILGQPISRYIDQSYDIQIFIYHDLKIYSWHNIRLSYQLSKALKHYDVIHINGQNGIIPHLLFFLPRKKFVFTIHDFVPHSGEMNSKYPVIFNTWVIKSKHQVILQNHRDYQQVIQQFPHKKQKVHFIPFGKLEIYRNYLDQQDELRTPNILFFGRISPYKGVEYLLEASMKLREVLPELRIIIAGRSNYDLKLNGSSSNVELINRYIPNEEMARLMHNCDLVVCPYTDATQSAVIMTAYAFNKPVVATRVGGIPEVVDNHKTGVLIPAKDASALAETIIDLYQHPQKINQMAQNIRNNAVNQELSWSSIAQKTKQLYQQK